MHLQSFYLPVNFGYEGKSSLLRVGVTLYSGFLQFRLEQDNMFFQRLMVEEISRGFLSELRQCCYDLCGDTNRYESQVFKKAFVFCEG